MCIVYNVYIFILIFHKDIKDLNFYLKSSDKYFNQNLKLEFIDMIFIELEFKFKLFVNSY